MWPLICYSTFVLFYNQIALFTFHLYLHFTCNRRWIILAPKVYVLHQITLARLKSSMPIRHGTFNAGLIRAASFGRFVRFFQNWDGLRWCAFFWGVQNTFPHTPLSEIEPKLASLGLQRPKRKLFLPDLKVAGFLYRQCRNGYRYRREDIVSAPESATHGRSYLHHDFAEFRRFSCARTIVRAEVRVILRDRRNFLICTMPPRTGCYSNEW